MWEEMEMRDKKKVHLLGKFVERQVMFQKIRQNDKNNCMPLARLLTETYSIYFREPKIQVNRFWTNKFPYANWKSCFWDIFFIGKPSIYSKLLFDFFPIWFHRCNFEIRFQHASSNPRSTKNEWWTFIAKNLNANCPQIRVAVCLVNVND